MKNTDPRIQVISSNLTDEEREWMEQEGEKRLTMEMWENHSNEGNDYHRWFEVSNDICLEAMERFDWYDMPDDIEFVV